MTQIGPLHSPQPRPISVVPSARAELSGSGFSLELAKATAARPDSVELSIPPTPPAEALDAVAAAAERAAELARDNRELHFYTDERSGRVVIEVRDLDGRVLRTIPPSEALSVLAGAPV